MKKIVYVLIFIISLSAVGILQHLFSGRAYRVAQREISSIQSEIKDVRSAIKEKTNDRSLLEKQQQSISKEATILKEKEKSLLEKQKGLEMFLGISKQSVIQKVSAGNMIKYFVIHHTASYTTIENEMRSDLKKFNGRYPYNYYIDVDGTVYKVNDEGVNVGSTLNAEVNVSAIQVALIGNFNVGDPSEAQYVSLQNLLNEVRTRNEGIQVKLHRQVGQTACPGKNFNINRIK